MPAGMPALIFVLVFIVVPQKLPLTYDLPSGPAFTFDLVFIVVSPTSTALEARL